MNDITSENEEKREIFHIDEIENKRKKDDEYQLVNKFFDGELIIHNKRQMTFADVIEFAVEPLPLSNFSRAMKYLTEEQPKPIIELDDLSQVQIELRAGGNYYNLDYEDYLAVEGEPGYFEYFDVFKQRYLKHNSFNIILLNNLIYLFSSMKNYFYLQK